MSLESRTFAWLARAPDSPHALWRRLWMAAHLGRQRLDELVVLSLERFSPELVEDALSKALERTPWLASGARRQIFAVALDELPGDGAHAFLRAMWSRVAGDRYARLFAARWLRKRGLLRMARKSLEDSREERELAAQLDSELSMVDAGLPMPPRASRRKPGDGPIIYLLAQALPFHSKGYSTRSHWLLSALIDGGWSIEAHTRFGYPRDRADWLEDDTSDRDIDVVPYHYHPAAGGYRQLPLHDYQRAAANSLVETLDSKQPVLIHAASDFQVGLIGAQAARRLGVPFIYEMRGLWHWSRVAARPGYHGSEHFLLSERLELQAAREADHVLAITPALRDTLLEQGVGADRITVVPNAVAPEAFCPRPPDPTLRDQLGDGPVIGFIGTFNGYEGLDLLVDAFARLRREHDGLRLLLVGDGDARPDLERRIASLDLGDVVQLTGRVPHREVQRYYSVCDLMAYPRRGQRVCELVSPIKPLEALAMARPVVLSDVGGQTGLPGIYHHKDDLDDLVRALDEALENPEELPGKGEEGRAWVVEHRSWTALAETVARVYRQLGALPRSRQ